MPAGPDSVWAPRWAIVDSSKQPSSAYGGGTRRKRQRPCDSTGACYQAREGSVPDPWSPAQALRPRQPYLKRGLPADLCGEKRPTVVGHSPTPALIGRVHGIALQRPGQENRRAKAGMTRRIRMLLADDHALFRAGMKALLEHEAQFEVVGETCGGGVPGPCRRGRSERLSDQDQRRQGSRPGDQGRVAR